MEIVLKDTEKVSATKPTRIPMKEMSQESSQGHTTGGATPSKGPPTGIETGKNEEAPPVREQKMGSCTIS